MDKGLALAKTIIRELENSEIYQEEAKPEPIIDVANLSLISIQELLDILGLTIKSDRENKLVTFLCELSAYTEDSQFNISYNAPSASGKSYIPTEIARLFPEEDVLEIGYCSPTAFFHEVGKPDKDKKGKIIVDLSRKILIFLDQPHTQLLERLRPLLSHDKKEISIKIADKTQKQGLRTKNVILRGFPAVIFCTAGLQINEQEATRFLLLSPELNQDKIRQGIYELIKKEADNKNYKEWLEDNPQRKLLKERLLAVKQADIKEVKITPLDKEEVERRFFAKNKILKPRHQRDIKRLISLIKSLTLLNLWWREKDGSTITANNNDIEEAFIIWDKISVSQELGLPPYIYNLYQEIIMPLWQEKNDKRSDGFKDVLGLFGLTRQEILQRHFETYGRMLDTNQFRQQILPMLETVGLISQEEDPNNRRQKLVHPTTPFTILKDDKSNSESRGGVDKIT